MSKSDFHSKAINSFLGHFNYYVMPQELYDQVKDEIPKHIGVYINGNRIVKNPKKQELLVDEQILKNSMIRSLYREFEKQFKREKENYAETIEKRLSRSESELKKWKKKYYDLHYENKTEKG